MLGDSLSGGFKNTDAKDVEWKHRKPLILNILKQNNPDIICVQECDKFDELFEELKQEYYGNFVKKITKTGWKRKDGADDHKDGVAIFIKRSKIKIEETKPIRLNTGRDDSQVALIHLLSVNEFKFLLVSTHLKSSEFESQTKENKFEFESWRSDQVRELGSELRHQFGAFKPFTHEYESSENPLLPMLVVGDMNAERDEVCMQYLYDFGLASAYAGIPKADCYTTYKKRNEKVKCMEEDYILYSKNHFKVVEILGLPPKTEFLPNETYPSDHLWLTAKLCF